MTFQDFIYSDDRHHRVFRHIAFWLVWWLAYFLFFHLPLHAISGWNLNELNTNMRDNGTWWIFKMLFFNSLLAVIVPQMIFTYILLYYLLPKFFYQKRNLIVVVFALIVFLFAYVLVSACFKPIAVLPNYWMGIRKTFPWPDQIAVFAALRDTLTSLPIIASGALAIKLMKRWKNKEMETRQILEEKIKAELKLLKAQIHPHFLFNTLNNIYFFTLTGSDKAPEMIKKLSDMLNYILNECKEQWVPLEKEIKMIEDYMALEKVRYSDKLNLSIEIPPNFYGENKVSEAWLVAPLLLIPFVENSFKHGASKVLNNPYINLRIAIENSTLHFFISNNHATMEHKDDKSETLSTRISGNIGLINVKKRLQLLYPNKHELNIVEEPQSYTVSLNLILQQKGATTEDSIKFKPIRAYERA